MVTGAGIPLLTQFLGACCLVKRCESAPASPERKTLRQFHCLLLLRVCLHLKVFTAVSRWICPLMIVANRLYLHPVNSSVFCFFGTPENSSSWRCKQLDVVQVLNRRSSMFRKNKPFFFFYPVVFTFTPPLHPKVGFQSQVGRVRYKVEAVGERLSAVMLSLQLSLSVLCFQDQMCRTWPQPWSRSTLCCSSARSPV